MPARVFPSYIGTSLCGYYYIPIKQVSLPPFLLTHCLCICNFDGLCISEFKVIFENGPLNLCAMHYDDDAFIHMLIIVQAVATFDVTFHHSALH